MIRINFFKKKELTDYRVQERKTTNGCIYYAVEHDRMGVYDDYWVHVSKHSLMSSAIAQAKKLQLELNNKRHSVTVST